MAEVFKGYTSPDQTAFAPTSLHTIAMNRVNAGDMAGYGDAAVADLMQRRMGQNYLAALAGVNNQTQNLNVASAMNANAERENARALEYIKQNMGQVSDASGLGMSPQAMAAGNTGIHLGRANKLGAEANLANAQATNNLAEAGLATDPGTGMTLEDIIRGKLVPIERTSVAAANAKANTEKIEGFNNKQGQKETRQQSIAPNDANRFAKPQENDQGPLRVTSNTPLNEQQIILAQKLARLGHSVIGYNEQFVIVRKPDGTVDAARVAKSGTQ